MLRSRSVALGATLVCALTGGTAAAMPSLASAAPAAPSRAQTSAASQLAAPVAAPVAAAPATGQERRRRHRTQPRLPGGYKHVVVVYEENHSFDNLMGQWGKVGRQRVDGLQNAGGKFTQVAQDGTPYNCLPQNDVNLTSPPQPTTCQDPGHSIAASAFINFPFLIDNYINAADKTCPAEGVFAPNGVKKDSAGAEPGGCTRDLVHRFYQEQYQIDGGKQDRYTTGSDAVGLTQGVYASRSTPLYGYLHQRRAPHYVVADKFFQAAFGGSFLNHQYLIAARAPVDTSNGGNGAKYSTIDTNGMPTAYDHYTPTIPGVVDGQLTRKCPDGQAQDFSQACGSYAVNTVQPAVQPKAASGASIPLIDDNTYPNIGDRLTARGVSWNWYSGGWNDANAGNPGKNFQFHHQPFNYFANYAPGQPGRAHLQDETNFIAAARTGHLPTVSFVKPYGSENQHPGYASQSTGSDHLVDLLRTITRGPQAKSTLVIVTYDEFGGQWDHVSPPRTDAFGPGTRIPALLIARNFRRSGVDHTTYDTTSILATLERAYKMAPLSSRDARVNGLRRAISVGHPRRHR